MTGRSSKPSLNRREFIATTTAVTLSHVAAGADAERQNLAAHIHPDVQIVREALPHDENAFWNWKEAADKLTSLYDFSQKVLPRKG